MKKPDELEFERVLREKRPTPRHGCNALDISRGRGMHDKRAYYLLEKWTTQGKWNYGVNARHGWFEDINAVEGAQERQAER